LFARHRRNVAGAAGCYAVQGTAVWHKKRAEERRFAERNRSGRVSGKRPDSSRAFRTAAYRENTDLVKLLCESGAEVEPQHQSHSSQQPVERSVADALGCQEQSAERCEAADRAVSSGASPLMMQRSRMVTER